MTISVVAAPVSVKVVLPVDTAAIEGKSTDAVPEEILLIVVPPPTVRVEEERSRVAARDPTLAFPLVRLFGMVLLTTKVSSYYKRFRLIFNHKFFRDYSS
jgi:hypothetical protein